MPGRKKGKGRGKGKGKGRPAVASVCAGKRDDAAQHRAVGGAGGAGEPLRVLAADAPALSCCALLLATASGESTKN